MKLNCGPTWNERQRAKCEWHPYFALLPWPVGKGDCRWLEYIERRGRYTENWAGGGWDWEYRAKE